MLHYANKLADHASFQAFTNCYLREIDAGAWHTSTDWQRQTGVALYQESIYALELQLESIDVTLVFGISYRSTVGRHVVTQVLRKQHNNWNWQSTDFLSSIIFLINNIYARIGKNSEPVGCLNNANNKKKFELLTRTLESHQIMLDYLVQRLGDTSLNKLDFIASEQSLLFGHWLHPTPKSRQGIHAWQHKNYTPELKANFQLHYFAISQELLKQNSSTGLCIEQIINQIAEVDDNVVAANKQLIPVHPLQAQWLLHQDYVQRLQNSGKIVDLGRMGKVFTPTSSVRTVYCSELDYMIKLSIPVKITNSLRQNMAHELEPGLNVGRLIAGSNFNELFPKFAVIEDPAYLTVKLDGMEESGFETIIRNNPFTKNSGQKHSTVSIAALVQAPILPGTDAKITQQVKALADQKHINAETAALLWFDNYWQCAIEPAIWLYEKHGVALEAHQQNSLITISNNCPSQYYYRDNQGFYLSKSMKETLLQQVPKLSHNLDLFYDDDVIADRVGYYLFINQLFSIISRLGEDGLIHEQKLLQVCYNKLTSTRIKLKGVGANFVNKILTKPAIPSKANLLTRVEDLDELQAEQELAVYTKISNPFYIFHQQAINNKTQINEVKLASA